ncbi:hypothetical protein [Methylocucumis oryzae]|uniref:PEGA domain-containing protein n=1 Tax=Methylocucumis oryzae TaxID=1632867 RepID=A0A0F3IIF3_9GAMM|nr:hypothetical protein [Methylocucumis oryzae]KJV06452.1 hypothetical protein VZ94_11165 [Methylocucumis oryzae]
MLPPIKLLIPSLIVVLSGCASIVSESRQPVSISSIPDRSDFVIVNRAGTPIHNGTTPATVTLKTDAGYFKGEKYSIKFMKDNYSTQTAPLNAELNGWYWGNLVSGGFLGMFVVDPLTGAMWSLPQSKQVVLPPTQ